eukprot:6674912-Prymnesium_polylepis.1
MTCHLRGFRPSATPVTRQRHRAVNGTEPLRSVLSKSASRSERRDGNGEAREDGATPTAGLQVPRTHTKAAHGDYLLVLSST